MLTQTYFPNYVLASTQHYGMLDLGRALTRMRNVLPHPSSMGIALLGGSKSSSKVKICKGAPSPGVGQVQRSGVEECYLLCQARDELCPTAGPYLMEMSRISSRFKSRHQEMDNASYLDMPQTTAGMRPLARRERRPEGLGAAQGSLQAQSLHRQLQSPQKNPEPSLRDTAGSSCSLRQNLQPQQVATVHVGWFLQNIRHCSKKQGPAPARDTSRGTLTGLRTHRKVSLSARAGI